VLHAGVATVMETDRGPMSDVQLDVYLRSCNLVGVTPEQVIQPLDGAADVSIQMVVSIVRPALAATA
jgi:hypothetical protein